MIPLYSYSGLAKDYKATREIEAEMEALKKKICYEAEITRAILEVIKEKI